MYRPVARPHYDGLSSAVHLSGNLCGTERSLQGHRESQGDRPAVRAGLHVCLQVSRQVQVNTAASGVDIPGRTHRRPMAHPRGHTPISRLDTQRVKTPFDIYASIAGDEVRAPVEVAPLNMPVRSVQADV